MTIYNKNAAENKFPTALPAYDLKYIIYFLQL